VEGRPSREKIPTALQVLVVVPLGLEPGERKRKYTVHLLYRINVPLIGGSFSFIRQASVELIIIILLLIILVQLFEISVAAGLETNLLLRGETARNRRKELLVHPYLHRPAQHRVQK
jgi:hypothetical protein